MWVPDYKAGFAAWAFAAFLTLPHPVAAAAIDDIKLDVSHELCEGFGASEKSFLVYATNTNLSQSLNANFKYDSVPAQQHFILFDVNLNPITDRFPKFHLRRLAPGETAPIGCTNTHRAAPQPPGLLSLPIVITKQSATYSEPNASEAPPEDARLFAAFYLQGGISECPQGAKPPGLFYLVNLHPYARLSVAMNLLDDRGNRVGNLAPNLAPLSTTRIGCSNGFSKPGPITGATLGVSTGVSTTQPPAPLPAATTPLPAATTPLPAAKAPLPAAQTPLPEQPRESRQSETPVLPLPPFSLGTTLQTQNICAGSVPPGWIKTNDAWNPTVCGNPTRIAYNVWTIQQHSDQPIGAVIHACKGVVPSGWAIVGTLWNPTVCGHPATNQPNVMAIKRLN